MTYPAVNQNQIRYRKQAACMLLYKLLLFFFFFFFFFLFLHCGGVKDPRPLGKQFL